MNRSLVLSAPNSCKVATPRDLASAMIRAIGTSKNDTWLEPCVGDGIFLELLNANGVPKSRIRAVDLDLQSKPNDKLAKTLRGKEFLHWSRKTKERFTKIVSNPPYVSLSAVDDRIVSSAMETPNLYGETVPKSSNLWYAFACSLICLLEKGGNIAMVLPASWDFADYSRDLRQELPKQFRKFAVFRAAQPLFEEVQDGSIVVVGIGYQQRHETSVRKEYSYRRAFVKSVENFFTSEAKTQLANARKYKSRKRLDEYLEIRIGGVTGHANYFLLTEAERLQNKIPLSAVCPVLSRSNHLVAATMTKDVWQDLRNNSDRVWLFRPPESSLRYEAVQRYLGLAESEGGCEKSRYKIQNRTPWYITRLEEKVDGFISGMSGVGPWICLNEMKKLNATNTLYTVKFRNDFTRNDRFALALFLLTSKIQRRFQQASRRYAQGLKKLEPSDLNGIEIGALPKCNRPISTYRKCIQLLLKGEKKEALKTADSAFHQRRV